MKVLALLALLLAFAGSGVPCAIACVASDAREHCHDEGDSHEESPCSADAVLAIAAAPPAVDAGHDAPGFVVALPAVTSIAITSPAVRPHDLPDRSPPVPPGFHVLRI